ATALRLALLIATAGDLCLADLQLIDRLDLLGLSLHRSRFNAVFRWSRLARVFQGSFGDQADTGETRPGHADKEADYGNHPHTAKRLPTGDSEKSGRAGLRRSRRSRHHKLPPAAFGNGARTSGRGRACRRRDLPPTTRSSETGPRALASELMARRAATVPTSRSE